MVSKFKATNRSGVRNSVYLYDYSDTFGEVRHPHACTTRGEYNVKAKTNKANLLSNSFRF